MNILGLYVRCGRPISIIVSRRVSVPFQWFSTVVDSNLFDDPPANVADVFQRWGCSNDEILQIFKKNPGIVKSDLNILTAKLNSLHEIGVCSSDLVNIIARCPRFFSCFCTRQFHNDLHERAQFLDSVFGSRQNLLSALIKHPLLFRCDIEKQIKPCIAMYELVGVSRSDLSSLIRSRPMLIMRSPLNDEKIDCINRFGFSRESKSYKYLVATISVSRLETIYRKVENLQKFGFSFEDVMSMLGRCPLILTMSADKVQRTMNYVIGTMKLPANLVRANPILLCLSLDRQIKPRFLLAEKIRSMGLKPLKGTSLVRAYTMNESRFVRVLSTCHEEQVAACLMNWYTEAKGSLKSSK